MEQCEPHPRQNANVISRLFFFYNVRIFFKGCKKSLDTHDLFRVLQNCRSKELGDQLEQEWSKTKGSICQALWNCFGKTFLILGFLQLVVKTTVTAWQPQAFSKLVSYFSPNQDEVSKEDAIYYACVVIALSTFNSFFYYNCKLALTQLGIRARTAVCSLLYRKSVKLTPESLSQVTVGKIVTIMTKDVDAFFNFIYYGNDVWIPFFQTGVICYMIYAKIGVAAFAGIAFYLLILPLQAIIGRMSFPLRLKGSKKTDERLELLQEVFTAVKTIKMYTWEKYFQGKINTARKIELQTIQKLFLTKVWIGIIGSICSKAAFFIFFLSYIYMGNPETNLTAEIVFFILSCCGDLEYSLSTLIPIGLSYTAEVYATIKRIDQVLEASELPLKEEVEGLPKIVFTGASIKLQNRTILEKVCLNLEQGLNVVVGHVGSGKTTLLKSVLQEFGDQDIKISGRVSYASQEPWLFPSTIRNNIIFGEKYNEERYQEVLKVCDLHYDLKLFPDGDGTVVGDRGLNLSKGQQTRINLARAVYKESDIYLLDDSLASLDVHVSQHIFKECILRFLKNKLCVFVTNNANHVSKADNVIMLSHGLVKVIKLENVQDEITEDEDTRIDKTKQTESKSELYHETKKSGKVSVKDYYKYVQSGGGFVMLGVVLVLFLATQATFNISDKLISNWITLKQNLSDFEGDQTNYEEIYNETTSTFNLYAISVVSYVILTLIKFLFFFHCAKVASINLHKMMTKGVINTGMSFFDSNFLGNILNRFSKDCQVVDESVPFVILEFLTMLFMAAGSIILLTTIDVLFLFESLFVLIISYLMKMFYQPTGRNLQRLNVATRSPMVGHLNVSLEGLTTIRASNAQKRAVDEFDAHQDFFTSANYMLSDCEIALGFGLEFFCTIFTALVIIQFLVTDNDSNVGDVGLAITQAFMITAIISTGINNISEWENLMTSVERIVEYTELKEEKTEGPVLPLWPKEGKIKFDDVSLCYDNLKGSLKNVSFILHSKEKLGIVGRTGAGKSSIISALLRLYPTKGNITIDDVNIDSVSLSFLRSKISVIPQDPFLFSGTVRENLDPFNKYRDEQIWKVLDQLQLKTLIFDLRSKIDKGTTFSAGQKQLLCLARAILGKNKIVILDEVAANVDDETDTLIQTVVRSQFRESTVINIAHKLKSVLRCDKVLVLNEGDISEFGEPVRLMEDRNSFLYSVVK